MASNNVVNPEDDFEGYMENLREHEAEQERIEDMLHRHEVWRQTTWSGWLVRQLQAIGYHFAPFFVAVEEAVSSGKNDDTNKIILTILIRVLTISAYVLALYAVARIINMFLGGDIVIEEEIVVEHDDVDDDDHEEDEDEDTDYNTEETVSQRGARDKKDQ